MTRSPSAWNRHKRAGFTLFEVIMALMILGLLSGAVYSISSAALELSKSVMTEQTSARRLEAFLRITRDAFLNLPADAALSLRISKSSSGAPVPELVFAETSGTFGVPSLGGGSLILAARPRADGSRTFSILRVPGEIDASAMERLIAKGDWISLLPGVNRVAWFFFNGNEWVEEWPQGAGRPQLVRLQFSYDPMGATPIEVQFWIPPLAPPQAPPEVSKKENSNPNPQ
jgi:prepilin-type N-terminal cleavage/methylation domain-containing protein